MKKIDIESHMKNIWDSQKTSSPEVMHIRGDELNKLIEDEKYNPNSWYQVTEEEIVELDI